MNADPELTRRVERGEYVVDNEAVAEAIVRRVRAERPWRPWASAVDEMVESGQLDRPPVSGEQHRFRRTVPGAP